MTRPTVSTRHPIRIPSGATDLAAWFYPGTTGACIVMAGGFAVPKEPGTDRFAARFAAAGHAVLAFDYRRIGASGGTPRQVARRADELADWGAVIAHAATLPGVDPKRVVIWGFSASGGHVLTVAARNPGIAAAIAQTPNADGRAATRNALRFQTRRAMAATLRTALLDTVGGWFGRPPRLLPLVGPRGSRAVLTTPDAQDGDRALHADRYPEWQQVVAARSILAVGTYRPIALAPRIACPLLVVVADDDQTALAAPSVAAAEAAPRGELVRVPGGHYAPFLDEHERVVVAELAFLERELLHR